MICKDSVLKWFMGLSSHHRIDLMCSLLNKCIPFEMRFLGTCLEDLGKRDFSQMTDFVVKANNVAELSEFQTQCIISDTKTRQKLTLYVCLLQSLNTACSTLIYKCLYGIDINQVVSTAKVSGEKILQELLTIYTVAVNHPAFSFEQRSNLGSILLRLRQEESRLHAEKLAEAVNADFVQAQMSLSDSSDGLRNIINSEMPPPTLSPGMGYPAALASGSGNTFVQVPVYPSFPGQQMTQHVFWPVINYQPVLNESVAASDMPPPPQPQPPYPISPLMSRHASPTQSAQHSRTNSPVRKANFPRGAVEHLELQLKTGTRPPYTEPSYAHPPPVATKMSYGDRVDGPFSDPMPLMETEVRGLTDKMNELSADDTLQGDVVSLNGMAGPSARSLSGTPAHHSHHLPPPPYETEGSLQNVGYSRVLDNNLTATAPPPTMAFNRSNAHTNPRYTYTSGQKFNSHNLEDHRNCSSSSGSDASSTSHSPPVTPANSHQNWEKGGEVEGDGASLSLSRSRIGVGRGRGRPITQGAQTLPRDRFPASANANASMRRDVRDGPRSAPPTPHEEKKTYLMGPSSSELGGPAPIAAQKPPLTHDIGALHGAMAFPGPGPMLHGPFATGPPMFQPYQHQHTFIRPPYSYPNGEVLYTYQPPPPPPAFLPSPLVSYSSTVPPPKISCYNCSQNHHPTDCKEPTMEEYSSRGQYRIEYGKSNDVDLRSSEK